jgi:hypothetical protein
MTMSLLTCPACHAELLLGVSVLLFRDRGPDFFLR